MKTVADLMTTDVITLHKEDTLKQARHLMRDLAIRHIPIYSHPSQGIVGILTERTVLSKILELVSQFGTDKWKEEEQNVWVGSIIDTNIMSVEPNTPLLDAGRSFLDNQHGCLLVVENDKLRGIVMSSDFVKLSVDLLQ